MKTIQGIKSKCCNELVRLSRKDEYDEREIFYFACSKCKKLCHLDLIVK